MWITGYTHTVYLGQMTDDGFVDKHTQQTRYEYQLQTAPKVPAKAMMRSDSLMIDQEMEL